MNVNDEFEEINGFKPSIRRSQIDEFTEDDAYVLLCGAGDYGHGYHSLDAAKATSWDHIHRNGLPT